MRNSKANGIPDIEILQEMNDTVLKKQQPKDMKMVHIQWF